jgi:hypothetical protein
VPPRRRRLRLNVIAVLSACLLALAAPPAEAGCPDEAGVTYPFATWGDFSPYALAEGGAFEGSPTWSGTGTLTLENDPFLLAGPGLWSMRLQGRQAITSPVLCVSREHPYLRFVTRASDRESRLVLEVLWTDERVGKEKVLEEHPADHWQIWRPSKIVPLGNALPMGSGKVHYVRLRFSLKDGEGDWLVDDVFLDPIKRG